MDTYIQEENVTAVTDFPYCIQYMLYISYEILNEVDTLYITYTIATIIDKGINDTE